MRVDVGLEVGSDRIRVMVNFGSGLVRLVRVILASNRRMPFHAT